MTRRGRWAVGAGLGILGLVGLVALGIELPPELGIEPPEGFSGPRDAVLYGTLPEELSESSGVAVSRTQAGVLWTHNDSGNEPVLFAIDTTGHVLGRFTVVGGALRDWEDISLGPCPRSARSEGERSCLYLADTGDNMRRRNQVRVQIVHEPTVASREGTPTERVAPIVLTVPVSYGGERYDVEALAVTPQGDLLLINKGPRVPVRVMRIRAEDVTARPVTPEMIAELDVIPMRFLGRMVTGAAISPDGKRLVVRTYIELLFHSLDDRGVPTAEGRPCFLGLLEPQGEAVDFLTDETVVITSEALAGRPGTIYGVTCEKPAPDN